MKNILVASYDMEVGGVERSLISLLDNFDYENNKVDLMLYRHSGSFFELLPNKHTLLKEIKEYSTFRKSIIEIFKEKNFLIGISRIIARKKAFNIGKKYNFKEEGTLQMQLMWKYSLPFLPKLKKEYDVAISYLWPHYFISDKVNAKVKIAWIHTDYSNIETDIEVDLKMWDKFNYIIAVSEECKKSFIKKYPSLVNKVKVIENITAESFIKKMSNEEIEEEFIRDKSFKLLSVARLSYAKGIDNAVLSLKKLHDKGYKNIKWYVVGYGSDEDKIKKMIKENGLEDSFILLGKKVNPYPYIKNCDLYVQPSRYEGKAVTVTEAKILGKAIVITKYDTANSQLEHMIDGYITEKGVEGIVEGIIKLYEENELREVLSNNCKKSNYSNKEELNKLYNLFN